tara:strand:+ start:1212 stop:2600 length:1389 start_codon:yes stop_codon:yes gene_type:complete
MAKLLKLRRGSTTQHASFTGAEGEVTIDTTKDTAVVHDGAQAGGRPLAREDMSNVSSASIAGQLGTDSIAVGKIAAGTLPSDVKITDANVSGNLTIESADIVDGTIVSGDIADGTIVNADINASAAIAGTKVSPDFGSQNVVTTGTLSSGAITSTGGITLNNSGPRITFTDSNENPDFYIEANGTQFLIQDATNSAQRLRIQSNGVVDINGNTNFGAGIDVVGNITVTGTVDGRDVATDGTKLDGIETGATADQTKSDIDALNINADQVDSLHASSFLRSDAADTASGDITFNGGAGAVTIAANSDLRLTNGSWTGESTKIQHHSGDLYVCYPDELRWRHTSGHDRLVLDSSGNLTASGNVTAYSDERLKKDISTINDALGICGKLRGVSYKWIEDNKPSIGVIAQEVEKVIPEVVLTKVNTDPSTGEVEEIKSVDYGKIVGVLINAINELKAEVDELKGGN